MAHFGAASALTEFLLRWIQCAQINKQFFRFKVRFTLLREYRKYRGGRKRKVLIHLSLISATQMD